jgi:hypothetical protein
MFSFAEKMCAVARAALLVLLTATGALAQQQLPQQVPLTDAAIQKVLAAKSDMDAIDAKYANEKPEVAEKKAMAEMDSVLKKHGFAGGLTEFDNIAYSIGVVLGSLDERDNLLSKEQIVARTRKEIEAANLPADEKKRALAEIEQSSGEIVAPLPGNVEIVKRQAKKLREIMQ